MRLLIVDDFAYDLKFMKQMIDWQSLGVRSVDTAENGAAALAMIEADAPDVVIADIQMPAMDGIALARAIHARFAHIAVVFMSCHEEFAYAQQAISLSVKAYIVKPLMPEQVEETMRRVMGELRASRETEQALRRALDGRGTEDAPEGAASPPDGDGRVRAAMAYIARHYADPITVSAIASELYVSPNYLNTLFKAHCKLSIPVYIERLRVQKACELLDRTELPLYEVAHRVGYSNVSFFKRVFDRAVGCTPREYRRKGGKP